MSLTTGNAMDKKSFEVDTKLEMESEKASSPYDDNSLKKTAYEIPPTTAPLYDSSVHVSPDPQPMTKGKTIWSKDSSNLGAFDASHYKMSESDENLIPNGLDRKGWSSFSSLEKSLSVALGLVSVLCLGFMIAVVVVGVKLNEDDYKPPIKATPTTQLPPWITTPYKTTPDAGCGSTPLGTNRPRPTTTRPPEGSSVDSNICLTVECIQTAGAILSKLNTSANPCEDFYEFACGGWMDKNPIPESESQWGQFDVLKQKVMHSIRGILQSEIREEDPEPVKLAQNFYKTCMNHGSEDELSLLTETVNDMFMMAEHDIETTNGNKSLLSATLGKIRRVLDGNYLFRMYVSLDQEDTSRNTIYLDQPVLGLSRKYLLGPSNNTEIEAYATLIKNLWGAFKPDDDNETVARDIIIYEKILAKISTAVENRRNKSELYNTMTIEELSRLTENSTIVWMDYFQEVFQDVRKGNLSFKLENSTKVVVRDMLYFQYIAEVVKDIDPEQLNNYLQWRILLDFASEGRDYLQEFYFQYDKKTLGIERPELRWEECSSKANNFLGMAISYRYVQNRFHTGNYSEFISKADKLVENIRTSFVNLLEEVDWIADNNTRSAAKRKAASIKSLIGFPEWLLKQGNDSTLLQKYHGLYFRNSTSHMQNCLDISRWRSWKELKEIAETKDAKRWVMTPTTVNAAYAPQFNSINLPLGILQPPFFNPHSEEIEALNYGAIGVFIGHEITHGFDDTGKQNDEMGNLRNWWDPKTSQNYMERAACFQKQYSSYGTEKGDIKVNGITTLGENIADNGGVREAYYAYQRHIAEHGEDNYLPGITYSPQQLFFLSYAQSMCTSYTPGALKELMTTGSHSPAQFRVKGVVENSEEFAYAWFCPRPANLNSCKIW